MSGNRQMTITRQAMTGPGQDAPQPPVPLSLSLLAGPAAAALRSAGGRYRERLAPASLGPAGVRRIRQHGVRGRRPAVLRSAGIRGVDSAANGPHLAQPARSEMPADQYRRALHAAAAQGAGHRAVA